MSSIGFEQRLCPICFQDDAESPVVIVSDIWYGKAGWFPIVRCQTCRIVFTKIVPNAQSIGYFYPASYDHFTTLHSSPKRRDGSLVRRYLRTRELPVAPPATVFEIGASNGAFVTHLLSQGYDAFGLEPSLDKVSLPADLVGRIFAESFGGDYSFRRKYDVIVAWMVLEHLSYPVDCCKVIRHGLTAQGVFVGSVPTLTCLGRFLFGRYWYGYQVPTHFTHFDAVTLKRVLEKSGFSSVTIAYEASCMNLLRSAEVFFRSRRMFRISGLISSVITQDKFGKVRAALAISLKLLKLSGRVQFEARP